MVANAARSFTRYPKFWGKGEEYVEQYWYLCESMWRCQGTLNASKLIEFHTTLRGRDLRWYMKFVDPRPSATLLTLEQVNRIFISEF